MPLSIFRGRPWPGPGEPLFTDDDMDAALAYQAMQASLCARCNTRPDEWIDPATKRDYDVPPYLPVLVECPGCDVKHRAHEDMTRGMHGDTSHLRVELRRNPAVPVRLPAWMVDPDEEGSPAV